MMNAFELAVMNCDIRLREFALPFTTVEQVAAYICDEENCSYTLAGLRAFIWNWTNGKHPLELHNWRKLGAELTKCGEIPADWSQIGATYNEIAQNVFLACMEVMAS